MRANYLPRDLQQRLVGGVIKYDGIPFYVQSSEATQIKLMPLGMSKADGIKSLWVHHLDELLDVSMPQLGYMANGKTAYFLSREATRRSRQSLDARGIKFFDPTIQSQPRGFGIGSDFILSAEFERMIRGIYPSVKEALENLNNGYVAQAISRDICLTIDRLGLIKIFYQDFLVGFISPETPTNITLAKDKFSYILERYLADFSKELSA